MLNVLAAVALAAALAFAWWSSRNPPPDAPSQKTPAAAARPTSHPAPFEAFAQAQVGDWYAIRRVTRRPPGVNPALVDKQPPPGDIEVTVVFRVRAVDATRVTRAMRGRVVSTGEVKDEPDDDFPRANLTLERLTGFEHGGWTLRDVDVSDDTHAIDGRNFPCKKVTFHPADPMFADKRTTTELWFSPEVPAGGLVAEHEVQDLGDMHFESTEELVGFGSAGGATWGALPEGL